MYRGECPFRIEKDLLMYISKNEIDKFRFDDCVIESVEKTDKGMIFSVSALIVKADNSQNSNYTESYAGDAKIEFADAAVRKIVKEGFKRYDANDVLVEEVLDEEIPEKKFDLKKLERQYLIGLEKVSDAESVFEVEFADEDPSAITDVYEITVCCKDITVSWDKYLNKVSQY